MKVLVCGGSGLLGRDLCKLFDSKHIDYVSTHNSNPINGSMFIDFFNENLYQMLSDLNITACVNCIVERQVDVCEQNWQSIKKTNIDLADILSRACEKSGIYMVHISTDYVFDGKHPPYVSTSKTNPLQNYGISKLISEKRVIANMSNYSIIRVPVLYTNNVKNYNESAVTVIGKKVLDRTKKFSEDNVSIRRPVFIPDFCKFILDTIIQKKQGIFHYYNPCDVVTKYQMSIIISEFLGKSNNVTPINTLPNQAARPGDTQLLDKNYDINSYFSVDIKTGLQLCFSKMYHPKLIPNLDNIFIVVDLDGTLIDTDLLHFECYKKALMDVCGFDLNINEYATALEIGGVDNFLKNKFDQYFDLIKQKKNKYIQETTTVNLIKNADKFIDIISTINHVVVTNTSKNSVDVFKKACPYLNKLTNWVTRDDYVNPKPNGEPYEIAKQKFYKGEQFIVGIENTYSGYQSLRSITDCIYMMANKNYKTPNIDNTDVFIIDDFDDLLS